jgi:hypothetical protein
MKPAKLRTRISNFLLSWHKAPPPPTINTPASAEQKKVPEANNAKRKAGQESANQVVKKPNLAQQNGKLPQQTPKQQNPQKVVHQQHQQTKNTFKVNQQPNQQQQSKPIQQQAQQIQQQSQVQKRPSPTSIADQTANTNSKKAKLIPQTGLVGSILQRQGLGASDHTTPLAVAPTNASQGISLVGRANAQNMNGSANATKPAAAGQRTVSAAPPAPAAGNASAPRKIVLNRSSGASSGQGSADVLPSFVAGGTATGSISAGPAPTRVVQVAQPDGAAKTTFPNANPNVTSGKQYGGGGVSSGNGARGGRGGKRGSWKKRW